MIFIELDSQEGANTVSSSDILPAIKQLTDLLMEVKSGFEIQMNSVNMRLAAIETVLVQQVTSTLLYNLI